MALTGISNVSAGGATAAGSVGGLTPADQRRIDQLKQIDQNVRAHEQAHLRAGRGIVSSGASFTYTYGPDGKAYAVGGEVGIDTAPADKPQASVDKARTIQKAALAPRDPSPQDYRVAAIGARLEATAQAELATQQREAQAPGATTGNAQADRVSRAYESSAAPPDAASLVNVFA